MKRPLLVTAVLIALAPLPAAAQDDVLVISEPGQPAIVIETPDDSDVDRHLGYYYPAPESAEIYVGRGRPIAEADRHVRVAFTVGLETEIAKAGQPIPYALFAKGAEAQKLIMVALIDGPLDTLYRARGVLANLTAQSRQLPIFQRNGLEDYFTFFDLLILLGYEQLTITDGKTWSHRIDLVPPG